MSEIIENSFPNLAADGYEITSDASKVYNCIAWVLGISTQQWDHNDPEGYWPERLPRNQKAETIVQLFAGFGYAVCDGCEREPGYEKVAIYAVDGRFAHVARQLEDGRWTSKLGDLEDITHPSPDSLAGGYYGDVHCIMRRPSG